jgi:dTMP kinase
VEGIDGSGKSTLARSLAKVLSSSGVSTATISEPSDGMFGRMARVTATKDPAGAALLFTLDRWEARDRLDRLLSTHSVVISDRSFYSTMAYQGCLLPLDVRTHLMEVQRSVARVPDLVLWLDGPLEVALLRVRKRHGAPYALERRKALMSVSAEYRRLSKDGRNRFARLDFSGSTDALLRDALSVLARKWKLRVPQAGRRSGR